MIAAILFCLQIEGVSLHATGFPGPGAHDGFTGIRVVITNQGAPLRATMTLASMGGHETVCEINIPNGATRDVAAAVFCKKSDSISVSLNGGSRLGRMVSNLEPRDRPHRVLCAGDLAIAEAASDAFDVGLPEILRIQSLPDFIDPAVFDGFSGIVATGLPPEFVSQYEARGGSVVPPFSGAGASTPLRNPSIPVAAAAADPATFRPGNLASPRTLPVSITIALLVACAGISLYLAKHPGRVLVVLCVVAATGSGAIVYFAVQTPGRFHVAGGAAPPLELRWVRENDPTPPQKPVGLAFPDLNRPTSRVVSDQKVTMLRPVVYSIPATTRASAGTSVEPSTFPFPEIQPLLARCLAAAGAQAHLEWDPAECAVVIRRAAR